MRTRRASQAGFTLVELTVAMVAGLIVALGIVGLSRAATKTFNEEIRSSAAESALRTAMDRLRADLQRAAFMSTGDIQSDSMINRLVNSTNNLPSVPQGFRGLRGLSAIQLKYQGSFTDNTIPQSAKQVPALAPDWIQIGGNMTCAEQFDVAMIMPPAGTCQQIMLSPVSASIYRVATAGLGTAAGAQQLSNVFAPVATGGTANQFMVRLLDNQGCSQFLATCPGMAQPAGVTNGQPYVWVDAVNTPILTAQTGGQTTCTLSGYAAGTAWVNPVQIVRWEIMSTNDEAGRTPQYVNGLGSILQGNNGLANANVDPLKYDLVRSYVDAGSLGPIAATAEIVAEYAVDLNFAFTVDTNNYGLQPNPALVSYAFDDNGVSANTWAMDVSTLNPPPASPPALIGPQRIRAVRARVVTRSSMADRYEYIPPVMGQFGQQAFMYRYCTNTAGCPQSGPQGIEQWARTRTATMDVTLFNNANWTY
ncbi:MAG TPA: prepilin-type N-terminal cleavage/methylation domain-containing protein [Polyangiaceae bacterium]